MNKIAAASTEKEILGAIQGFIAGWAIADVDRLPEHCRPRAFTDLDDLARFCAGVTDCYRSRRHEAGATNLLREMVEVFSLAVDRGGLVKREADSSRRNARNS